MSELLIDAAWLASHRDEVVVADVRWSATGGTAEAERAFEAGHISGAVFFDVDRDLAGTPFVEGPGRHPLPSPEWFAEAVAAAGIGPEDRVVAYDDAGGSVAARLWWMFDAVGRSCALLDGGLAAWPPPLETGPVGSADAGRGRRPTVARGTCHRRGRRRRGAPGRRRRARRAST
jgi:thiosulfate/3-mercaptopyruvate sulfurtransferase